jgi:hypothetical protein
MINHLISPRFYICFSSKKFIITGAVENKMKIGMSTLERKLK